jgi:hypothetical protein
VELYPLALAHYWRLFTFIVLEGFNMTISKMFPVREINKELRNEIRDFFDSDLNATFANVIARYGLTRDQVKKILMSDWEA